MDEFKAYIATLSLAELKAFKSEFNIKNVQDDYPKHEHIVHEINRREQLLKM